MFVGKQKLHCFHRCLRMIHTCKDQLKLTSVEKKNIRKLFFIFIYLKCWFQARNATYAPINDHILLKNLQKYQQIGNDVSQLALMKLKNRLEYLPLGPVGIFSDNLPLKKILQNQSVDCEKIQEKRDRFAFKISKSIEESFLKGEFKSKTSPLIMNTKCLSFPSKILEIIDLIAKERRYSIESVKLEAIKLNNYLFHRELMYEKHEMKQAMESAAMALIDRGELSVKTEDAGSHDFLLNNLSDEDNKILMKEFYKQTYHWKNIDYTEYMSFLYLYSRAVAEYATLVRIFHEIKKRSLSFKPETLFDFGSGVGTVTWAVDEIWPETCKEIYNVDTSSNMHDLHELIIRGGQTDGDTTERFKRTVFRQFLPSSNNLKYDMVVSSHTLFEVGDLKSRTKAIDILWRKVNPGGFLVLVEVGSKFGYSIILSSRDYLLEIARVEREKYGLESPIHVFSPCPHDNFCPMYVHRSKTACYFNVKFNSLFSACAYNEIFSYVVLQKADRDESIEHFPRIIAPVLKRSKHFITRNCTPGGNIRELVVTKSKQGSSCYQLCKACSWGDFLPVNLENDESK